MFVYPGQPSIGEAIMHLLLACDNEPEADGRFSPLENQHAQIAISLTMIALESIVKHKLHEKDEEEPQYLENVFLNTLDGYAKNHPALKLWTEVKILRNQIIHSGFFATSVRGGKVSAATRAKLDRGWYAPYVDMKTESTNRWQLIINPLGVSRYEALVALAFFSWYGKETGVWKSNQPLGQPYVDPRMESLRGDWIDTGTYYHLIGHGPDFDMLIAFLSGRLPPDQKGRLYSLVKEDLQFDMEKLHRHAITMLEMLKNTTVVFGDGKKKQEKA